MTIPFSTSPQHGGDKCGTEITKPPNGRNRIKENTTIGTWSVYTLQIYGRLKELTHELATYKWDIPRLSEVRWTGFGVIITDEGHQLLYSGKDSKHQHGVAFIVNKKRVNSLINSIQQTHLYMHLCTTKESNYHWSMCSNPRLQWWCRRRAIWRIRKYHNPNINEISPCHSERLECQKRPRYFWSEGWDSSMLWPGRDQWQRF